MIKKFLKIIGYIFAAVLFLFGVLIYSYPFINAYVINKNSEEALEQFRNTKQIVEKQKISVPATESSSEEKSKPSESESNKSSESKNSFTMLYEDMQKYNTNIYKNGQKDLKDAWSYEQSGFDLSMYGIYNGVVAELRIPKMNVDLPIYLGATWNNMGIGVAQLGQTSMPIGGNNTNCVIAGHRGSSGGRFFLDIEMLEIGDKVYIDNLWETLTYRVEKIEIIDPYDIDKIHIQKNKDMLTLITCHPYPYNYQRYVVYCERYYETAEKHYETSEETSEQSSKKEPEAYVSSSTIVTEVQSQKTIDNDNGSQIFIMFENSLYILVPAALIVLAVCLFKHRKR